MLTLEDTFYKESCSGPRSYEKLPYVKFCHFNDNFDLNSDTVAILGIHRKAFELTSHLLSSKADWQAVKKFF